MFAKMLCDAGLMSDLDYKTYQTLFARMSNFMQRPTLLVFLDVTPEEAFDRIHQRGRVCENKMTIEYLQQLYNAYQVFIVKISQTVPVLRVRYDQFVSVEEMAKAIYAYAQERTMMRDYKQ